MAHFFTFADRACRLQFFEDDPIVVTLFVGDKTDKACVAGAALIDEGDKEKDFDRRFAKYREALVLLLGEEKTAAVLARAETADSLTLLELWQYVVRALRDQKLKNLTAPVR